MDKLRATDYLLTHYTGILAHNPVLQCNSYMRKDHHPHAIPLSLPNTTNAHRLLDDDRIRLGIWNLVRRERVPELCPCGKVLESVYPRLLSEQTSLVVLERSRAHSYRPRHSRDPSSCIVGAGATEEAENSPLRYLCTGRIVRSGPLQYSTTNTATAYA